MEPMDRNVVPVEELLHKPFDRRAFMRGAGRTTLGVGLLGGLGGLAAACTDDGGSASKTTRPSGSGGTGFSGLSSPLKIGVIVPTSGIGQFLGDIVGRSLGAAKGHIDREALVKGVEVEYQIVNAPAEQFAEGTAKAYNQLVADPSVIGILWCTPVGLTEALPQIRRDQIPVMAVYADPYTDGTLYPESGGARNVFQMLLPDSMSFDAMCRYAARDRGYETTALIYDSVTLPGARGAVREGGQGREDRRCRGRGVQPVHRRLRRAAPATQAGQTPVVVRLGPLGQHCEHRSQAPGPRRRVRRHPDREGCDLGAAHPRIPGRHRREEVGRARRRRRPYRDDHRLVPRRTGGRSALPDPRLAPRLRRQGSERRRGRCGERVVGAARGRPAAPDPPTARRWSTRSSSCRRSSSPGCRSGSRRITTSA